MPVLSLDFDSLSVHGDIECSVTGPEKHERKGEQPDIGAGDGQRERQAEPERGQRGHEATAKTTDQPASWRQCEHGTSGHREEYNPELTITDSVLSFDRGDVWNPTGED